MKILVTSGATREPLDEVRFLSNVSTGATGAALADALTSHGHEVVLLAGQSAAQPAAPAVAVETFSSARDLLERLARRLGTGGFDLAIMAAAVSDYRPETSAPGKISSHAESLTVHLVRNPKLLPQLKALAPRPLRVIGFKLTVGANAPARAAAVAAQFAAGGVDAVVHNDLAEIRAAAADAHPFHVFSRGAVAPRAVAGIAALVAEIERLANADRAG